MSRFIKNFLVKNVIQKRMCQFLDKMAHLFFLEMKTLRSENVKLHLTSAILKFLYTEYTKLNKKILVL